MTGDLSVVQKALAAVCGETREGGAADAKGEAADAVGGGDGGIVPAFVAWPGSTEEAAAVVRVAAEHGLAVVVRGAGGRLGWGRPPARCDLLVDMSRMGAVVEHSSGDLVARVQAGARMGDVAAVLAQAGQEIALDVPADATIGGVVASGLAGPRRLLHGTPRDLLIGITIVRADGTVAKSGGKVVKNVAGYDLGKLLAGSAGTLALITEATFRLHPLPAARAYVTAEYVAVSVACDAVAAAANSPLVASAVELSRPEPGGPIRVGVLLEGSADGVAARAYRMANLLGPAEIADSAPSWWPGPPAAGEGTTLVQVSFWVSALSRVLDAIDAAARESGLSPVVAGSAGAGVLYLRLDPDVSAARSARGEPPVPTGSVGGSGGTAAGTDRPGTRTALFVDALRSRLARERGGVVVLAAPATVREALAGESLVAEDRMAGTVPALALMRAVKDQFDPGHRMAPGRFPEVM
jgi:glycolate oxidase FAD binding subunit